MRSYSHPHPILAGGIGNIVEWYIFLVYAYLTPEISRLFFPHQALQNALVLSFLIYAAGFLARPIGAVIFGWMGDRLGRQTALLTSQILMVVTTVLFAALPTYAQWGAVAALALAVLRVLQGISIAGEYTTSLCYLAEVAPLGRRYLWVSSIPASTALGILLSALVVFIAVHTLSPMALLTWGWRACVSGGAVLALVGIYLRYRLPETPVFLRNQAQGKPAAVQELLRTKVLGLMLLVMMLGTAYAYCYQFLFVWVPNVFAHNASEQEHVLLVTVLVMVVFMGCIVLGGALSDRYGRQAVLRCASLVLLLMWWPLSHFLLGEALPKLTLFLLCGGVVFGVFVGSASAYFADAYPSRVRASALSLSYNITYAVVGGLTPVVLETLKQHSSLSVISGVSMAIFAVAFAATFAISNEVEGHVV